MSINIKPLYDRVVVRRKEEETTTPGGILIPDTANKDKPVLGVVLAVGPGKSLENGDTQALAVQVGDTVLFGKYSGTEVKFEGEEYVVMREDDLMAVIAG